MWYSNHKHGGNVITEPEFMAKHKNQHGSDKSAWLSLLVLVSLGLLIVWLLKGTEVRLFNPKGVIARSELELILFPVFLGLVVIVPTMVVLYFVAWKYRETNERAAYHPGQRHGKFFVFSIWAVPSLFMLVLALVMWPATHRLAPKEAIASEAKPITIQVVAMRWKWLFIYPEQNIATVNYIQIPEDTPVQFDLTADETPMSSFWIPHLGGQLYAMTGHVNRLNLMADEPGDYPGSSAEINGRGFAGMKFTARASSKEDFDRWVLEVQRSQDKLDAAEYKKLLNPSENNPAAFFATVQTDLYAKMLTKYSGSHNHKSESTDHDTEQGH